MCSLENQLQTLPICGQLLPNNLWFTVRQVTTDLLQCVGTELVLCS
jgi:hypothetical protein